LLLNKIRVMIADDNPMLTGIMCSGFKETGNIEIAGVARNGIQTLKMISEERPDILILDMIMPFKDGLEVIEEIFGPAGDKAIINPDRCILMTVIRDIELERKIADLGVAFLIEKPPDLRKMACIINMIMKGRRADTFTGKRTAAPGRKDNATLFETAESEIYIIGSGSEPDKSEMAVHESNGSIIENIRKIMNKTGIPAHLKGYRYLQEAILKVYREPGLLDYVTKKLYPLVAEDFRTTPARVESSMRNAIELAWGNRRMIDKKSIKPYNSEYIAAVANELRSGSGTGP